MPKTPKVSINVQGIATPYTISIPNQEKIVTPVIVLLHGANGDSYHMDDPATRPGNNYDHYSPIADRDDGIHLTPPLVSGINSVDADLLIPVRSWETALNQFGFRTVTYSQFGKGRERIATTNLEQLTTLLRDLCADPMHAGRKFAILAHSRGGILVRAALVDGSNNHTFDLSRFGQVITLHSPHQGSTLANAAAQVSPVLQNYLRLLAQYNNSLRPIIESIQQWLQDEIGSPGYDDFQVGSPFLNQLAADEPVPGIQYYTFGGTSAELLRLRFWSYTPESTLGLPGLPTFHWTSHPLIQSVISPQLNPLLVPLLALFGIPPIFPLPPEATTGLGDVLVTDIAARLPFSIHRTNPLNHAEALWDQHLQEQVAWIIDPVNGPKLPAPAEPPGCQPLRDQIANLRAEIRALQTDLDNAPPPAKPGLARQIRAKVNQVAQLRNQAVNQGCVSPI